MRSAADFLPSFMIEFMNLVSTRSPNLGSGMTSRLSALRRLDISLRSSLSRKTTQLLGSFCSVFRSPLPAIADALGVEHTANDVVAYARKVFDAPAPDQHHRQLLYRRHRLPFSFNPLAGKGPHCLEPKRGPHRARMLQRLNTEDLGGIAPKDLDPDLIPVSPAASNPRPKATSFGPPPAA